MLDENAVIGFTERLSRIRPESRPQWGTLRPPELMSHLRRMIEISLEEISVPDYPIPFGKTRLFRWGVLYLPWPKGRIKAPESALPAAEGELSDEMQKLVAAMHRFTAALARDPHRKTRSPLLGPIPLRDWAKIHSKHLNHHLEQFGARCVGAGSNG